MSRKTPRPPHVDTTAGREKQREILTAALETFMHEGYATASMDRIAERARASKRTVYNYFPTKETLFHAVLNHIMAPYATPETLPYHPELELDGQLEQLMKHKNRFLEHPDSVGLVKVIAGMLISHPQLVQQVILQAQNHDEALTTWLIAADRDGRLHVPDPALAARTFWGMANGLFFWPTVFEGPLAPHHADTLGRELVQMFLARYARRPE